MQEEAEHVRLALEGREFDGIPMMVVINAEPLTDVELAFETLGAVVDFRMGRLDFIEDPTSHKLFSDAIEQLQGHAQNQ